MDFLMKKTEKISGNMMVEKLFRSYKYYINN